MWWALCATGKASALVVTSVVLLEACCAADVCAGCMAAALLGLALCRAVQAGVSWWRLHQVWDSVEQALRQKLLSQEEMWAAQVQSAIPCASRCRKASRQHQVGPLFGLTCAG